MPAVKIAISRLINRVQLVGGTPIQAIGGIITRNGNWINHTFKGNSIFTVIVKGSNTSLNTIKISGVGGGGSGCAAGVGSVFGGGQGGQVIEINYLLNSYPTTYSIQIGDGGTGVTIGNGAHGNSSIFTDTDRGTQVEALGGVGGVPIAGTSNINGANGTRSTLTKKYYGGGGGSGNSLSSTGGIGGIGGGGNGGSTSIIAETGFINSGAGGGGQGSNALIPSGSGAKGEIVISYLSPITIIDTDAELFITNAGITDATEQLAARNIFWNLKQNNFYTGIYALYLYLGSSANSTKFNAVNPVDSDAAYRITWSGGLTHSSTGVLPDGSTGYGNTHFNNNIVSANSMSLWTYSRTNILAASRSTQCDLGTVSGTIGSFLYVGFRANTNDLTTQPTSSTVTRSIGVYSTNRNTFSKATNIQYGALLTISRVSSTPANAEINIFRQGGTATNYSAKEHAIDIIAKGYGNTTSLASDTETIKMETIIEYFVAETNRSVI